MRVRRVTSLFLLLCTAVNFTGRSARAQTGSPQAPVSAPAKPAEKPREPAAPQTPAQIELLETRYRFEGDGSSRKEVHTVVRINSELGVRQFARLNFDFNRTFETVEIPLVRVTHSSGGTADVLPSAITDNPNPAVASAPAYQDVRVKSVRILGLEPSDTLEYRVITTNLHPPLAPDFWLFHSFDRSGVVSKEIFEIDLPSSRHATLRVNPATPGELENSGEGGEGRDVHRWQWPIAGGQRPQETAGKDWENLEPDIAVASTSWEGLAIQLDELLTPGAKPLAQMHSHEEIMTELSRKPGVTPEVAGKARDLSKVAGSPMEELKAIYDFVSQKITTVELPLGATGFAPRKPAEILSAGYATPEDKFVIFAALASVLGLEAKAALTGYCDPQGTPGLSGFNHLLISAGDGQTSYWLDPSLEVAPFGVVSAIPQKCVLLLNRGFFATNSSGREWQPFERKMPFAATQRVNVDASLAADGRLTAKVKYVMRGDNELLLRIAFHQSPREKWKDVAQLLSLSDGFRGQITDVSASDPMATRDAFTVEYEISQAKFVDWAKKPVRIPAILPLVGLPDPPAAANLAIELGTPLEVMTEGTVKLPEGFTASAPVGTSVARDYATFSSKYDAPAGAAKGSTLTAWRHITFLARQIPGDRAGDYRAFLRAVQNDEAQGFVITAPATGKAAPAGP